MKVEKLFQQSVVAVLRSFQQLPYGLHPHPQPQLPRCDDEIGDTGTFTMPINTSLEDLSGVWSTGVVVVAVDLASIAHTDLPIHGHGLDEIWVLPSSPLLAWLVCAGLVRS